MHKAPLRVFQISKLFFFSLGNVNIFYYFACVYSNFLLLSMCAWPLVQYKVTILSITVENVTSHLPREVSNTCSTYIARGSKSKKVPCTSVVTRDSYSHFTRKW